MLKESASVRNELLPRLESLIREHGKRRVAYAIRLYARRHALRPQSARRLVLVGKKGPGFV